ncbi:uncharacterized protein LOC124273654 [Haliotis rubra]|uniref:uncharacterized protein LOC124273654 n=1 Tax=Haliotis rubra TaxID=36100 RepID=UPI001EE62510|nr:uncharacterized protein LOC124273654 [Haliotis rubra]XP_046564885.1 uncharacterized protein LOC124273654 [Haliotis rubra]XP_046564886.1 uncharacterized protein LOC124273654 [Haliotis rubra]
MGTSVIWGVARTATIMSVTYILELAYDVKRTIQGDYCETYKECGPKECAQQAAQGTASTTLAAILVPVFIILISIIVALIVYNLRIRSKGRKQGVKQFSNDEGDSERLTSQKCNNTAASKFLLAHLSFLKLLFKNQYRRNVPVIVFRPCGYSLAEINSSSDFKSFLVVIVSSKLY